MSAASPSPIMEAAFGRLHNSGGAAFGGPPSVVESIMVDGEMADIGNTHANVIFARRQNAKCYDLK